jgi:hypothetical protein
MFTLNNMIYIFISKAAPCTFKRACASTRFSLLNKLLTVQLLIQKRTEVIVFDNDAKGCYNRIISGIALACLK